MHDSLGFAIIGCGVISRTHAEAISSIEGARLAVACSRTPEKARQLAEQYGAAWCTDFREAVVHPEVEAVSVCTPSGLHAEPTLAALGGEACVGQEADRDHPGESRPDDRCR